ncbi:MAG: molybdenum cofactor guanylyltransferase, partial [Terriglobales bacterium]
MANNLSAFVLVGGKSTRMGTDKAALQLDGRTLLEHALLAVGLLGLIGCLLTLAQPEAGTNAHNHWSALVL